MEADELIDLGLAGDDTGKTNDVDSRLIVTNCTRSWSFLTCCGWWRRKKASRGCQSTVKINDTHRWLVEWCFIEQSHVDYLQSHVTRNLLLNVVIHLLRVFINLQAINLGTDGEKIPFEANKKSHSENLINCHPSPHARSAFNFHPSGCWSL